MSARTQAKLLRVLQDRLVTRLGGSVPVEVDVRVIAATNASSRIRSRGSSAGLFYRPNVVPLVVPRAGTIQDLALLTDHFPALFARQMTGVRLDRCDRAVRAPSLAETCATSRT